MPRPKNNKLHGDNRSIHDPATEGPPCNTSAFDGPVNNQSSGAVCFWHNCRHQFWRWNTTTGDNTMVLDPTQEYSPANVAQITDAGLAFFFASQGPQGAGTYTIDLNGLISKFFAGSFSVKNQPVTYPADVIVSRDGTYATGNGIWNNATETTFKVNVSQWKYRGPVQRGHTNGHGVQFSAIRLGAERCVRLSKNCQRQCPRRRKPSKHESGYGRGSKTC